MTGSVLQGTRTGAFHHPMPAMSYLQVCGSVDRRNPDAHVPEYRLTHESKQRNIGRPGTRLVGLTLTLRFAWGITANSKHARLHPTRFLSYAQPNLVNDVNIFADYLNGDNTAALDFQGSRGSFIARHSSQPVLGARRRHKLPSFLLLLLDPPLIPEYQSLQGPFVLIVKNLFLTSTHLS